MVVSLMADKRGMGVRVGRGAFVVFGSAFLAIDEGVGVNVLFDWNRLDEDKFAQI